MNTQKLRSIGMIILIVLLVVVILGSATTGIYFLYKNNENEQIDITDPITDPVPPTIDPIPPTVDPIPPVIDPITTVDTTLSQKTITEVDGEWTVSWDLSGFLSENEKIEYVEINDSRLNLHYYIEFKSQNGVFYDKHEVGFWTEEGPGDDEGNGGYDEAENDGRVILWENSSNEDHKIDAYEGSSRLTSTSIVKNYDYYQDDGWIFAGDGSESGYGWTQLIINSEITQDNQFKLTFSLSESTDLIKPDRGITIDEFDIQITKKSYSLSETTYLETKPIKTSSTNSSDHQVTWKIDSDLTDQFDEIDSITILKENFNMWYGTLWKTMSFIGMKLQLPRFRWTEDGPGDWDNKIGWNEAEKDGNIVIEQSVIPADNQFHQIIHTDVYAGYDEYQDTGWWFAGDGSESGYDWKTLDVEAKYNSNTSEFTLKFSDVDGIIWTVDKLNELLPSIDIGLFLINTFVNIIDNILNFWDTSIKDIILTLPAIIAIEENIQAIKDFVVENIDEIPGLFKDFLINHGVPTFMANKIVDFIVNHVDFSEITWTKVILIGMDLYLVFGQNISQETINEIIVLIRNDMLLTTIFNPRIEGFNIELNGTTK